MTKLAMQMNCPAEDGNRSCLGSVGDFQLAQNALHVVLHRVFANGEAVSDLFVALSLYDRVQYVQFSGAQIGAMKLRSQGVGDRTWDVLFAAMYGADGLDEFVIQDILGEIGLYT